MAHEVVMPQLGLSMDSGEIIKWLKQPGERVQSGDPLLEVESDKSVVEVEAVESGILLVLRGPGDGAIPVGQLIGYLLAEDEQPPLDSAVAKPAEAAPASRPADVATPSASAGDGTWPRSGQPASSPAARRRAQELGVDWRLAAATGRGGRIKERDVVALAGSRVAAQASVPPAEGGIQISPVARRMAEAAGVSLEALARQHPGRRLGSADVEAAIRQAVSVAAPASSQASALADDHRAPSHRQPAGGLRRLIADRMSQSAHTTAPVTLTTEADATELVAIRERLKADPEVQVVPSYNALFAALVGRALVEHPHMNASFDNTHIVIWETVNLGIAVETERGLVVPVVRDLQTKPLRTLAEEIDGLLSRASQGKALPDELTGGTFTITNLGAYEIDAFTPIINAPECAVLGIGRLVQKVVVVNGEQAIRTMLALSLTFDHRLVDGAPAARFLQRVKQFAEQPDLWLV